MIDPQSTQREKFERASSLTLNPKPYTLHPQSTQSEKFERVSKFAATAEQLFVFTATLPLSRYDPKP